jgi:hypothetical protein
MFVVKKMPNYANSHYKDKNCKKPEEKRKEDWRGC